MKNIAQNVEIGLNEMSRVLIKHGNNLIVMNYFRTELCHSSIGIIHIIYGGSPFGSLRNIYANVVAQREALTNLRDSGT